MPTRERDDSPGEHLLDLAPTEVVAEEELVTAPQIARSQRPARLERVAHERELDLGPRFDAVVIGGIVEDQRQDPEVGEVLAVDSREALGQDGLHAEEARRQGGVLAARPWP